MNETNTAQPNTVALRVHSRSLSIAMISALLQSEPTTAFEKGTVIDLRSDSPQVRSATLWILIRECEGWIPLENCIENLVQFLEERVEHLAALGSELEMDLVCGCWVHPDRASTPFALSASLMKRLLNFSIDIFVDIIPFDQESAL